MKRLVLSLALLCISSVPLYSMDCYQLAVSAHSAEQFKLEREIKEVILKNPVPNLTDCRLALAMNAFTGENVRVCLWFALHIDFLQPHLKQCIPDASVTMMGSRYWQTSHLLSDIDAAVITNADPEKIFNALQCYYTTHYPQANQMKRKTKANLPLFSLNNFYDPMLGSMKLEYVILSPEIYQTIIDGTTEKLKTQFPTWQDKTRYACSVMIAVHNNDEATQKSLKQWTNILPAVEKL